MKVGVGLERQTMALSTNLRLLNTRQLNLIINLLALLRSLDPIILENIKMESVDSNDSYEIEPDQDEVPAATGVEDTSRLYADYHIRDDFGPVGVNFF